MNPLKDTDSQIDILNTLVKVRIAPSPIHGVGIFAIRNIQEGEKLYTDNMPEVFNLKYEYFNRLRPEIRQILLERYPLILKGSMFVYPDARMQAYMNHSTEPNYDAVNDRALRDIKEGEEITEDYRKIEGSDIVHADFLQV